MTDKTQTTINIENQAVKPRDYMQRITQWVRQQRDSCHVDLMSRTWQRSCHWALAGWTDNHERVLWVAQTWPWWSLVRSRQARPGPAAECRPDSYDTAAAPSMPWTQSPQRAPDIPAKAHITEKDVKFSAHELQLLLITNITYRHHYITLHNSF